MSTFKTIKEDASGIFIEKKSKFIANIMLVESKQEAEQRIKEIKKQYSDARHNCYAYCVLEEGGKLTKSSDDGEPSGTAGIPILKVICEKELCNVLVVVTRYFGGILLGTGGLVRAYTNATLEAIANAELIQKEMGYEIVLECSYTDLEIVKYYLKKANAKIVNIEYTENIKMIVEISNTVKEDIMDVNSKIGSKIQKIGNVKKKYIEKNIEN